MEIDPSLEALFQSELDRLQPGVWTEARIAGMNPRFPNSFYFSAQNLRRKMRLGIAVDSRPSLGCVIVKQTAERFRLVDIGRINAYNLVPKISEEGAASLP